jgi:uncharacterized protein YutE (UPF0331/DUF86 family)
MTDEELVSKKLAFIETCLRELRTLARPDVLETDIKERRFIEHTLQVCIQALQDVASHIVSDERLGEPEDNRDLLNLLAGASWLPNELVLPLRAAIGFRNVLVHGYTNVDPDVVRDVIAHHLTDIEAFVSHVRGRLGKPS